MAIANGYKARPPQPLRTRPMRLLICCGSSLNRKRGSLCTEAGTRVSMLESALEGASMPRYPDRRNCCLSGFLLLCAVLSPARLASAQTDTQAKLSVHWEELTGGDFIAAIKRAQGTCVLPFG